MSMIKVQGRLELQGSREEEYMVQSGGCLIIRGRLRGRVSVSPGAEFWLFGTNSGEVTNQGGKVVVLGESERPVITLAGCTREFCDQDVVPPTQVHGALALAAARPTTPWSNVETRAVAGGRRHG
jgi:hypothetical protein